MLLNYKDIETERLWQFLLIEWN